MTRSDPPSAAAHETSATSLPQADPALPQDPLRALFESELEGLIVGLYENETPPRGLLGRLDWAFKGLFSLALQKKTLSGALGQCTYFPLKRLHHPTSLVHFLLVGLGDNGLPGARPPVALKQLPLLRQNLKTLGLVKLGISRTDFGWTADERLEKKHFNGVPVWILT